MAITLVVDRDSRILQLPGLKASNVIGLSDLNRRLLVQRGAEVKADAVTKPLTLNLRINHTVARRSGSPLHQSFFA